MKYSQVLVSALFGSMAAAIPFKRDLVTKTEVAIETVVVYTTVYEDDLPVAEATTTAGGYFYEQPSEVKTTPAATSTPAVSSTPVNTPSPVQEPSSVYTPPVETSAAPSSTPVVVSSASPAPEPVIETSAPAPAAPTTTEAAYTPAPVASSAAPAATSAAPAAQYQASSGSSSTGESFSDVDLTINPVNGALGACGKPMNPEDITVALAQPAWGASTYDTMTGEATNKWCGQKINIEYNGKSVEATIMDMCPGCAGHDIDLSDAAWAAIGMTEYTRVKGSWSMVN